MGLRVGLALPGLGWNAVADGRVFFCLEFFLYFLGHSPFASICLLCFPYAFKLLLSNRIWTVSFAIRYDLWFSEIALSHRLEREDTKAARYRID